MEPSLEAWKRPGISAVGLAASMAAQAERARKERKEKSFASPAEREKADEEGSKPRQLHGHDRMVSGLTFSSDGMLLASISGDASQSGEEAGILKIHNVQDGTILRKVPFIAPVTAVAFSPTELLLAVGCEDGSGQLQPVMEGASAGGGVAFRAHAEVSSLSFSADGKRLACAELGSRIVVRDTSDTMQEIAYRYDLGRGGQGPLAASAFAQSEDSLTIAAASTRQRGKIQTHMDAQLSGT